MEYYRHGRSLVPLGQIFEDADNAIQFCQDFEKGVESPPLNNLRFAVDEEGYLNIGIDEQSYFISYFALKDLCRMLKLPISFVNKFPPSKLMLENLNQNPYLLEDGHLIRLITWQWEEKNVITGVLPAEAAYIPLTEYLTTLNDESVFQREATKLESIVITGEEVVQYFLLPEEIAQDGYSFTGGYALHYRPLQMADTIVQPFYRMNVTSPNGEIFDFDFESAKKLHIAGRRKKDFEDVMMELSTEYSGEDIGVDFENTLKRGTAARKISSIKFGLLKALKSRATSIYSYTGHKVEGGAITEEVIPEYKQFLQVHRERLKTQEKFETNNMPADFYLPLYLNRIFTFRSSSENPYFFIRYRRAIGTIFDKILEEASDEIPI